MCMQLPLTNFDVGSHEALRFFSVGKVLHLLVFRGLSYTRRQKVVCSCRPETLMVPQLLILCMDEDEVKRHGGDNIVP